MYLARINRLRRPNSVVRWQSLGWSSLKGRVERANGTFQDRLVTELLLEGQPSPVGFLDPSTSAISLSRSGPEPGRHTVLKHSRKFWAPATYVRGGPAKLVSWNWCGLATLLSPPRCSHGSTDDRPGTRRREIDPDLRTPKETAERWKACRGPSVEAFLFGQSPGNSGHIPHHRRKYVEASPPVAGSSLLTPCGIGSITTGRRRLCI